MIVSGNVPVFLQSEATHSETGMAKPHKQARAARSVQMASALCAPAPDTQNAASPVEDTIDYKIGRLRKALDRYSAPVVSEFGLTLAEWRVLTHIRAGTSVTASWLCERLLVDKAEVSRACGSLIERGLVASKPNPADARSSLLRLTATGRAIYARVLPARLALDAELVAELSQPESDALCAMLEQLTNLMLRKIAEAQSSSDRPE